jgi:hypothetical protein
MLGPLVGRLLQGDPQRALHHADFVHVTPAPLTSMLEDGRVRSGCQGKIPG